MKEEAIKYYEEGYNCSQCILKAAEDRFHMGVTSQCYNMCKGINTGLGIGTVCSVLSVGTMIFGLLFDVQTTKRLRLQLITAFQDRYKGVTCSQLIKRRNTTGSCSVLIGEAAELIEEIILMEQER